MRADAADLAYLLLFAGAAGAPFAPSFPVYSDNEQASPPACLIDNEGAPERRLSYERQEG